MTLHITTCGQGPDLVMVHGWAMNSAIWDGIAGELARGFRLHMVDLPGHGYSVEEAFVADLESIVRALCANLPARAHWLGWSLGGTLSLYAALTRPERIARMIVVGGTPRFVSDEHWPHGIALDIFAQFTADLIDDFPGTLQRFLMLQTLGNKDARRSTQALAGALAGRPVPTEPTLRSGLALLQNTHLEDRMTQIQAPTLLIHGTTDRLVPVGAARYLANALPHAVLHTMPDTGHAPFISRRDEFIAAVTRFLS